MLDNFLKTAVHAVESSGKILIDYFEKLHDFRQKNQNFRDLVTEVDILSEKNIKDKIIATFPDHTIIGEESGKEKHDLKYCWYVDPLDGTVNYSQGIPLCAVSVGMERNGEIIVGAVYNPFTNELFFASKGNGAYLNGRQIYTSQKDQIRDGLYIAGFSSSPSQNKYKEYEIFGLMNDTTRGVLRIGSAALALAYLACGRIDGFWAKDLFPWDLAAGIILVSEAGGRVSGPKGVPYSFNEKTFIASNDPIHDSLLEHLKEL